MEEIKRSEEVQEIMGTPPSWLIRWGTTALVLALSALALVSWLVKYPDRVIADFTLTTMRPPVPVIAQSDGYIDRILVADGDSTYENSVLAVLSNPAAYKDVEILEQDLLSIQGFEREALLSFKPRNDLRLGELQSDYAAFTRLLADFSFNNATDYDSRSIRRLKDQISNINAVIRSLEAELDNTNQARLLAERQFTNIHRQYKGTPKEKEELEKAKDLVTEKEVKMTQIEADIYRNKQKIGDLNLQILAVQEGVSSGNVSKYQLLQSSMSNLLTRVEQWKQKYLLLAPTDGLISFYQLRTEQAYVQKGDKVMAILPFQDYENLLGEVRLPVAGSGKVGPGQRVLIKFDSYPYQEFGLVEGVVDNKALLPQDDKYYVLISLPNRLRTNFGKELPFRLQMAGKAEIITEDKRFLERILEKFIQMF